jgi:hypothetical protein
MRMSQRLADQSILFRDVASQRPHTADLFEIDHSGSPRRCMRERDWSLSHRRLRAEPRPVMRDNYHGQKSFARLLELISRPAKDGGV